ncbi:MAG: peptidoglycan DD-metalloendopeptidase family protein [Pseudomonadota bacterium]|nr:peptidoglycan DD-metalloendopeptidase family protein [Pseudomonadota bacterium]
MLIRFYLFVVLLTSCSWANADKAIAPAQELKAVKTEIQSLSDDVNLNKASKESLFKQLKQQSRDVADLNKELNVLGQKMNKLSVELSQLALKQQEQHKTHGQQLEALNQQIRAAFINGQPSVIKVVLNQESPATLSRSTIYYRYFHQARQQQLSKITETLQNLSEDQKMLFAAQKKQQQFYAEQESKRATLRVKAKQREATLTVLDKKITSQDSRLQLLREQELSLQALLKSLNNPKKSDISTPKRQGVLAYSKPKNQQAFAKNVGGLVWPVKGKLLAHYGSPRNLGKLTWQGIMIAASSGDNVVAAATGRVVFADWLRGFGLLLIIDHGDQYMSLYGNNESLLKQVGEQVKAGDLIAQSGENDVRQQAGLYFEIRYKGSPTNPMKWLRTQS